MTSTKHVPLPKDTKAFICANCGAISLSPNDICKLQGKGLKGDWCGTRSLTSPSFCHNKVHNIRYKRSKCQKVAVHPELLCEPERMKDP